MEKGSILFQMETIEVGELMPRCAMMKNYGWRLCQIHSVRIPDGYEVTYTLAKDYDLYNFKVVVGETEAIPSITPIFSCAWMYENEIVELFGVNIKNILRNYQKKLYKIHVETPFK